MSFGLIGVDGENVHERKPTRLVHLASVLMLGFCTQATGAVVSLPETWDGEGSAGWTGYDLVNEPEGASGGE